MIFRLLPLLPMLFLSAPLSLGQKAKSAAPGVLEDKKLMLLPKEFPEANATACFIFLKKEGDDRNGQLGMVNGIRVSATKDTAWFTKPFGINLTYPNQDAYQDYLKDSIGVPAGNAPSFLMVTKLDPVSVYYLNYDASGAFSQKLSSQLKSQLKMESWSKRKYWVMISQHDTLTVATEKADIATVDQGALLYGGSSLNVKGDIRQMEQVYGRSLRRIPLAFKIFIPVKTLFYFETEAESWVLDRLESGNSLEFFINTPTDQADIGKLEQLKLKYRSIKFNLL